MEKPDKSEESLGKIMVEYLTSLHWEVFQEVETRQQGSRADIVARRGPIVGVIECKRSFGLPVLEQAYEWREHAHFIWIATWSGNPRGRLVYRLLEDFGIGWWKIYVGDVREAVAPRFNRRPPRLSELTQCLVPQRQAFGAAGSARGGHWTPFRATCHELERIAKETPGVSLRDALSQFKHHYANTKSAMCALPEWIEKGKVPGVRLDRSSGKICLVPASSDSSVGGARKKTW